MTQGMPYPAAVIEQATGLYEFFVRSQVRFIPVLSRPRSVGGILALDQLCSAMHAMDLPFLSVGERHERLDAAAGVPVRDPGCAHPRPVRPARLDSARYAIRRPARAYLGEVAQDVPDADLVLVHAAAGDLAHLLSRANAGPGMPRRILLCNCPLQPASPPLAVERGLLEQGSAVATQLFRAMWRAVRVQAGQAWILLLRLAADFCRPAERGRLCWNGAAAPRSACPAPPMGADATGPAPAPCPMAEVSADRVVEQPE